MVENEGEAWSWFVEALCKLCLWLIGTAIVLVGLIYMFVGPAILKGEMGFVYILWIVTFIWAFYWYLTSTLGGSRLLRQIWAAQRRLAKAR